jgi:hypothetical protein
MIQTETEELIQTIKASYWFMIAHMVPIGDKSRGECCVKLQVNDGYFLWSQEDWEYYEEQHQACLSGPIDEMYLLK